MRLFLAVMIPLGIAAYFLFDDVLTRIGNFLVVEQPPAVSEAVVVLFTGLEYYPRLIEAADLVNRRKADKIVINGNRKTDILRDLEKMGFAGCCSWYDDYLRILRLYGISEDRVITLSVEDAYDTISEAQAVGKALLDREVTSILLVTSKSHTRRAGFIWRRLYGDRMSIRMVSAKTDVFDPAGWWRDGRQIRWVLAEYGAWVFYFWKRVAGTDEGHVKFDASN